MTNILRVTIELLNGVCVVIAAVTFELRDVVVVVGGCGVYDVIKFIFIAKSTWELIKN